MKIQRKRGAPKGNQNAVKHGFYSKTLNPAEQLDFNIAAGMEGIIEEIALLRFEIKKAISGGDIRNLVPLTKAALALEKLIRTHHKIFLSRQLGIENALENVIRNVMLPLSPGGAESFLKWHYRNKAVPRAFLEAIQRTNNGENEADLTYNKKQISEAI
jgi:hypothetical protein